MPEGVKSERGNHGGTKPRTPGTLCYLLSYARAPFWEEKKKKKDVLWLKNLACLEGCVQDTDGCHSVLCPCITSRVSFLREDLRPATWETKWLTRTSAKAKEPLVSNLTPPSSAFPIPAEPVNPHKCTVKGKKEIFCLAMWLYHLFNICWVFLVLFCFGVGVGADVTSQF